MAPTESQNNQLLTTHEVAARYRLSKSFWNSLRVRGGGPRFFRIGSKVFYRKEDIERWLEGRCATSTAEYAGKRTTG